MQTGVTGDEIVLKGASSLSPILEQLFGSGLFKASQCIQVVVEGVVLCTPSRQSLTMSRHLEQ